MAVTVQEETARQDAVAALLQQSDALAARLYPNEYRKPLNPETLSAPGIHLFVARQDSVAAGCCALIELGDNAAELKRMIVNPRFRGQGIGMALLLTAEATAARLGIHLIQMEVGIRNADGQALYRRAGYQERGPFGFYQPSPISQFFEKPIQLG